MTGGIEYQDKKATMQEIHAYKVGDKIQVLSRWASGYAPDETLSYEDTVVSAGENLWPCHAGRR